MTELNERELVLRAKAGGADGRAAFEEIVRREQAWMVRYLLYLLGDIGDAEDVAQEAFVRAYHKLGSFRAEGAIRPWLRTLATRLAFNYQRARSTRRGIEEATQLGGHLRGPEAQLASREVLLASLSALSYPYREILLLRYVEELPLREISELLDIGESAAKMRLSRAREALRAAHEELATP